MHFQPINWVFLPINTVGPILYGLQKILGLVYYYYSFLLQRGNTTIVAVAKLRLFIIAGSLRVPDRGSLAGTTQAETIRQINGTVSLSREIRWLLSGQFQKQQFFLCPGAGVLCMHIAELQWVSLQYELKIFRHVNLLNIIVCSIGKILFLKAKAMDLENEQKIC